ncbi:MAG: hypothetical protein J5676_04905 [Bacteroidaceae bacterium]|nr:hypothetical protein [Bacteroidaceae bacterium]
MKKNVSKSKDNQNEDWLYINSEIRNEMEKFCSKELIDRVLKDFGVERILNRKSTQSPSRSWIITNYISRDSSVDIIDKLNVILSFFVCGGVICIKNINYKYPNTSNDLNQSERMCDLHNAINNNPISIDKEKWERHCDDWNKYIIDRKQPYYY